MDSSLKFVYTTIFEILGVMAPEKGDAVLIDDPSEGVWACLTRDAAPHRKDLDEGAAVGTMLLRGLIGKGPEGAFPERLRKETAAVSEERSSGASGRHFLVVRLEGLAPDWESRAEREVEEFVIRLNGAPKLGLREQTKTAVASIVISITQRTGRPVQLRPHAEGLVFFREDGKKVYAKELKGGPANLFVSTPWDPAMQKPLQADFQSLQGLTGLTRIHNLFAASIEQANDRLRAFQAGWSALEIFVNKVFSDYEAEFLGGLTSDSDPRAKAWYVERIRDVMKDKYRLRDRFALIATLLDPGEADKDVGDFVSAKKSRDDLAHGQDVADSDLPVEIVHRLLAKYLHLHASRKQTDGVEEGGDIEAQA